MQRSAMAPGSMSYTSGGITRRGGWTVLSAPCLAWVLLALCCAGPAYVEASRALSKRFSGLYTGPYFEGGGATNITTQLGTHAYLPCKVKQLGNKSVSWIRRRDAHILTVDRYTFIADERFQAFLVESSGTWTLQVKYVQARDAGTYECQVSSEPKVSALVQLHVVVPETEILGEADIYVRAGSTVSLKCVVRGALEGPSYIFWYHGSHRVLLSERSGWHDSVDRVGDDTTVGTLVIEAARREDSGNYSCSPSNLKPASATLHVLNGEHPAAMQRGKNSAPWGALGDAVTLGSALLAVLVGPRVILTA